MQTHPLAALRRERHLSTPQLADLAGVSLGTVSRIEHYWRMDRPTPAVRKIAVALDVPVEAILADDQLTYRPVAEFLGMDVDDPQTRVRLASLKEAYANA